MIRLGNFLFRYRNAVFPVMFVLLFVNSPRIFPSSALAVSLGIVVALLGQALRVVTIGLAYIKRGGKQYHVYADTLVQEGMFNHCRNPLYVGNFVIVVGLALVANSLLFAVVGLPFFLIAYRAIVAAEENYLSQKFGEAYAAYCRRVNRFVPDFSGFGATWRGMDFDWRRVVIKEYGSTFPWVAAVILLLLKHEWLRSALSQPTSSILVALLVLTGILYAVARYLKKSRILRASS